MPITSSASISSEMRMAPIGDEARPHLGGHHAAESAASPGLLTTAELAAVRDALLDRLAELDDARADVIRRLTTLEHAAAPAPALRRSSPTLSGARVRWVAG